MGWSLCKYLVTLANFQKWKGQTKFKLDFSLPLSLSSCLLSFSLFSSLLFLPHFCLSLAFYFPHKHTYAFTDPHNPHRVLLNMHYVQRESESVSCSVKPESVVSWTVVPRLLCPRNSPGKSTEVGSQSLLQGIFPTQGSNPDLLHCRQILSHGATVWGILQRNSIYFGDIGKQRGRAQTLKE